MAKLKKILKKIGLFLFKYVLTPILVLFGVIPIIIGSIVGAFWLAFKAGWNMVK